LARGAVREYARGSAACVRETMARWLRLAPPDAPATGLFGHCVVSTGPAHPRGAHLVSPHAPVVSTLCPGTPAEHASSPGRERAARIIPGIAAATGAELLSRPRRNQEKGFDWMR